MLAFTFGLLAVLLLLGAPVFLAIFVPAGIWMAANQPATTVAVAMFDSINKVGLASVPFFILMGNLMVGGGAVKYLVDIADGALGHVRGGLAAVVVLSSMFFAAISGSSTANAAALGIILYPEMVRLGYDRAFSAALIAVGGTLGALIPPSIPMILIGIVTEQSIIELFRVSLLPGVLTGIALLAVSVWICRRRNFPAKPRVPVPELVKRVGRGLPVLVLPFMVLGSLYGGIATVTETAVVGAVYAFFVGRFVYRQLDWNGVLAAAVRTGKTTSFVFLIIVGAEAFAQVLAFNQVPQQLTDVMVRHIASALVFLLAVNLLLLFLGDFLDAVAIIFLTLPLLFPVVQAMHINPLYFAVMFVINMEVGMITPPVGLNTMVMSGISGLSLYDIFKGSLPLLAVLLAAMLALVLVAI